MPFFSNRDINRLGLQAATGTLASALSYVFSAVFLLHAGLTPAQIFLAFAAILALRFVMRPLILVVAPAIGLRRALILGTFLCALSCPVLALVDGIGPALAAFVAVAAMGQVFYCTCYHVFFTTLGDADHRGSQVGAVQALGALAAVCGPALGGFLLAALGPGATFGAAFVIALLSIVPLLHLAEPKIARERPPRAYAAARTGMWLYFADGWIQVSLTTGWSLVLFQAVGGRYDSFGGTLSLAALAGALGGMALGRIIDMGHSRHAVWLNAGVLVVGLVLRSAVGDSATAAVAVAVGTTLFSGLYLPTWMTPVYNAAKLAPCALRFQFAAEGGWDAAGTLAGLIATGFCLFGLPLATTILLALPMILLQGLLLEHSYAAQHGRDNERAAVRAAI
jgi:MFS transporter, DHA1 family, inner membrane transport protein